MDEKTVNTVKKARDRLLATAKTLHMAVWFEDDTGGHLEQGQAPFIRQDGHIYIYSSQLSAHIRGILAGGETSFLLIEDEATAKNIWARKRIKFSARIEEISRDDTRFEGVCDAIGTAHGEVMQLIREFSDFHLFKISPVAGVLVTGFAAAYQVKGEHFELIAHLRSS